MINLQDISLSQLSQENKLKLMNKFADFKRRQGSTSIVFQSLPEFGVWTNEGFYSLESIFNAVKSQIMKGTKV